MRIPVLKFSLILAFVLGCVTVSSAQMTMGIGGNGGFMTSMALNARGGLKLPNMENVEGSPYLDNDFHNAAVRVKSGFDTAGILVKFNVYGNEIVFLKDGTELALDSVDEVSYAVVENGNVTKFVFKSGYPTTEGLNQNSIYRVLAAGPKVHVLKYYTKRLEDIKTMGEYNKKEFIMKQQLYIYSPAAGVKKIKADKQSLIEALPELAPEIEKLVADKKIKIKKDNDVVELVDALNQL